MGGEGLLRALEGHHLSRGPHSASPRSCTGRRWGTPCEGAGLISHRVAKHAQLGTDPAVMGSHQAGGSRQAGAPCFGVGGDGTASGRAQPDHTRLHVSSGNQLAAQGAATISKEAA